MLNDRDPERRSAMLGQLKLFPVVGTVARWDVSKWDGPDVYGHHPLFLEIQGSFSRAFRTPTSAIGTNETMSTTWSGTF